MSTTQQTKGPARPFRMPIDGVRSVKGRGTLVSGTIQQGAVRAGESISVLLWGVAADDVARNELLQAR